MLNTLAHLPHNAYQFLRGLVYGKLRPFLKPISRSGPMCLTELDFAGKKLFLFMADQAALEPQPYNYVGLLGMRYS